MWALTTDICALSAIIFGCFLLASNARRRLRIVGAAAIVLFSAFAVLQVLFVARGILREHNLYVSDRMARAIEFTAALTLIALLLRRRKQFIRECRNAFLFLSPAFVILMGNSLWAYHTAPTYYARASLAGMLASPTNHHRVVWMIFDELDGRMLLHPPHGVDLPEFARLERESLVGTQATSPSYSTTESLPSLITGKFVAQVSVEKTSVQLTECRGSSTTPVNFYSEENVFQRARAAGFNVGISGWAYPYCRMFPNWLSACAWDVSGIPLIWVVRSLDLQPFYSEAVYLAWWQSRQLPFSSSRFDPPQELRMAREGAIETLHVVAANALLMLRNPNLNLVFLHFPIPHPPGIWDRKRQMLSTLNSEYLDNLLLADKVLGQMRSALEQNGEWDRTTVLVSADHPYRPEWAYAFGGIYNSARTFRLIHGKWQPYIPFLLKLPSQHDSLIYSRSFNSIISRDVVMQALQGAIETPAQAAQWLDEHASPHPGTKRDSCGG